MNTRIKPPVGFFKEINILPRERRFQCSPARKVLPGDYIVQRIIAKRFREVSPFVLVRWSGYDPEEDTWEPKKHLTENIIQRFENPQSNPLVDDARERIALVIERGMKRCLRTSEIIDVRHDAIRCLFPGMSSHLGPTFPATKEDLISAGLRSILEQFVSPSTRKKCILVFPIGLKLSLDRPPQFFSEDATKKKRRAVVAIAAMTSPEAHYVVMEMAGERTLLDLIDSEESLSLERRQKFSLDVARALEFIHGQGLLHMDTKPATSQDACKLADFGCCRQTGSPITPGSRIGTYAYMAPEVIKIRHIYSSTKADICRDLPLAHD